MKHSLISVSLALGNMGLFGYMKGATAKNFYMSGVNLSNLVASTSSTSCVGPVAGMTDGTNSFSKIGVLSGSVVAHKANNNYATGGLVGWARSSATNSSTYTDCFSRATITQSSNSHASRGGVAGYSNAGQKYENCYFAGAGAYYAMDGSNKGNFTNSYYLNTSSSNPQSGVMSKTAGDLQDAGFPFTLNNGKFIGMTGLASTVWAADADTQANWRNGGYPLFGNFYPTDWSMVGKAVDEGTIVGTGYKMTGRGTAVDPYQIATPEALAQMSHLVKAQNSTYGVGKYYRVTADLDLKGLTYTENGAPLNWEPIGGYRLNPNVDWIFRGTFDGGLHTIDNLSITGNRSSLTSGDRERNGLFGAVTRPAEIKNIYLSNVVADRAVGAARQYAGSLVAYVDETGTSGSVVLSQCGVLSGSLKATGTESMTTIGGLVGMIDLTLGDFVMRNCFSRADLSASNTLKRLSGLVGVWNRGRSTTVENSYFAGSGANNALLGNPGTAAIGGCYYQDTSLAVGGVGQGTLKTADELKAWDIPFALNGNKFMGMRGVASTVWNRDALDASTQRNSGYPLFGNLYPENWGSIGQAVHEGSLVGPGFKIGETGKGIGTAVDPYQISTPEALAHLSYLVKANNTTYADTGKWYTITSDIDLTGSRYTADGSPLDWQPIGNATLGSQISFDGSLHTIANLTISAKAPTDGRLGLFGGIVSGRGATDIKNIYLKDIAIAQETAASSGALAGYINYNTHPITVGQVGVISGVVKGKVSGGLVGSMQGKPTKVENCFSRAKLEGSNSSGGIAGNSTASNTPDPSTYLNCYFAGEGAQYAINGSDAGVFANSYYLENSAINGHTNVLPQAAGSMKVWAFANTLNSTSNPAVWTTDTYTVLGDGSQQWRNGGFPLYGQLDALSWAEVGKRVQEGVITTPSAGTSVKPLNVNDADAGSVANPYQIDSPEALAWYSYCLANKIMGDTFHNASIELVADIDLAGTFYTGNSALKMEWLPIGTSAPEASSYRGHFDGNFHTVSNLTKKEGHELFGQRYYEQGLFGQVDSATIENVALTKVELAAANNADSPLHAGALVARVGDGLYGAVTRIECVAVEGGTIALSGSTSKAAAGGLVGSVDYSPVQIRHSFSRASLQNTATGAPYAGGLVGVTNYHGVQVESCYFAGSGATSALAGQGSAASASTFVNGLYLDTALNVGGLDQGIKLTGGQLTSWGAAYQLNNGTEAVIDSKIWRKAHLVSDGQGGSVLENGGYPVLIGPGATDSNQHMDAAQNWAEVGEWVALFGGNGNRPADPTANRYIAAYPETLAWYAAMLNSDSSYGDYKSKAIAFAKPCELS